jgi:hypothetical protein
VKSRIRYGSKWPGSATLPVLPDIVLSFKLHYSGRNGISTHNGIRAVIFF